MEGGQKCWVSINDNTMSLVKNGKPLLSQILLRVQLQVLIWLHLITKLWVSQHCNNHCSFKIHYAWGFVVSQKHQQNLICNTSAKAVKILFTEKICLAFYNFFFFIRLSGHLITPPLPTADHLCRLQKSNQHDLQDLVKMWWILLSHNSSDSFSKLLKALSTDVF